MSADPQVCSLKIAQLAPENVGAGDHSVATAKSESFWELEKVADTLLGLGETLFGISIGAFGIQHFIYSRSTAGLFATPPFSATSTLTAYLIGAVFVLASLSFMTGKMAGVFSGVLGAALCLDFFIVHVPRILGSLQSGVLRTRGFETLAMAATVLIMAVAIDDRAKSGKQSLQAKTVKLIGRLLLVLSLTVFGIQHFMYLSFVASLIPSWIPWHLFWTALTGLGFLAAALSIGTGKVIRLAGILLATMFLVWVISLHAPRVAHELHKGNEWSSMFVALSMSGTGLIVAGTLHKKHG